MSWVLVGCHRPDPPSGLVINEVLSQNDSAWIDPASGECPEYDDFVELYNRGPDPVSLLGLWIGDSTESTPLPHRTLAAGEHLVLIADEDPEQGELHLPFGVSADGEVLILGEIDGPELDRVTVPAMEGDTSWGRYGDGAARWRIQVAPSPEAANEAPPADPCQILPPDGFDDHTVPCISTPEGFFALADTRTGLSVVKLDVLSFQSPEARHAVFLDGRFYALHDEWYLFRMLNGQPVEGEGLFEPYDGSFATIAEIGEWAASVDLEALFPPGFVWIAPTGRVTSSRYYDLALGDPRIIGAGTLIHAPATDDRGELWAFELEYSDTITHDELVVYFETLEGHLGPEMTRDLRWLIRSPDQEALAQQMEAGGLSYADRVLRYTELSSPGTVEVYHEGTVAGRVKVVRAGEPLGTTTASDILVLEDIPDELPPCAALITSVPQTPLAHIALLAESRGIPNLHVAGLAADPQWDSWSRVAVKVVLRATAPDGFEVATISAEDYATWLTLQSSVVPELVPVDVESLPWTVDLPAVPADELLSRRPAIGGKSSGFLVLLGAGAETPELPLAITIRAYHRQLEAMGFVEPVLAEAAFGHPGDPRGRYLVLEGPDEYDDRFPLAGDATYRDTFLAEHAVGTPIGDLARTGGLRQSFVDTPIAADVLAEIVPVLTERFGHYAPEQGLRFRSSSNIEDVEGFVGAGLYGSYTGWLDPSEGPSVEAALQQVWASYWGFEAFEERHVALIPHEAGGMGVLVHANFEDELERANGVITLTHLPDGGSEMVVNSQIGAISVTNPPVDSCVQVLPEVAIVRQSPTGERTIERLQASTELPDGEVLDDPQLLALFDQALPVVELWLEIENAALPEEQWRSTLTLDLEFRDTEDGWPILADGPPLLGRMVLKQARSLEPSAAGLPDEVQSAPFPRDLLARARIVTEVACSSASHALTAVEAVTNPALPPDLGYAEEPFTASIVVDGLQLDHLDWDDTVHPSTGDWGITVQAGSTSIDVDGGQITVDGDSEPLDGPCVITTLWASPETWLEDLLDP